jgi:threonylcarbamoyladenosine tRNA methylthiotransferase MtaB
VTELSPRLLDLMAREARLVPHLHLPLQSGSDRILRLMRRPYTRGRFADAVARARARLSDPAITTDIIVGFPGETEDDFAATLAMAEQAEFSKIHLFPYSPRAGTDAARMPDQVPAAAMDARKKMLMQLERTLKRRFDQRHLGSVVRGLVEGLPDGPWHEATTDHYQKVVFASPAPRTGFVQLRLLAERGDRLVGELAS